MNQQRTVSIATKLRLANERPFQLRLFLSLVLIPLLYIFTMYISFYRYINNGVPDVDYSKINARGQLTKGVVKGIEFTDSFENPTIISYTYSTENGVVNSKYQTLVLGQIKIGDNIDIKYFEGQSIIVGLQPFSFPFIILFAPVFPFLIIGVLFGAYYLFTLNKQIGLVKRGMIRDAELISFTPRPGLSFGEKVRVMYRYKISGDNKIEGASDTRDLSITKEKKPGDTIKIFVSPDNEFASCLVSAMDAKTNNWKIG